MKKLGLKKLLVFVIAAVIVIGAVAWSLWPEPVDTINPEKRDIDSTLRVSGTVNGDREQTIYSIASSKIADSDIVVGSIVSQGDVLATYDTTSLENEVNLAEDALACANGSIKDAQGVQAAYSQIMNNAGAKAAQYQNDYNNLSNQINNLMKKQESNSVAISNTISDLEGKVANLERDYDSKSSELEGAEETLANLRKSDAYVAYEAYSAKIPALENDVDVLQAQYDAETDPTEKSNIETKLNDKKDELQKANEYIAGDGPDVTSAAIPVVLNAIDECEDEVHGLKSDVKNKRSDLKDAQNQLSSVNGATLSTDEYATLLRLQTQLTDITGKMEAANSIQASAMEGKAASSGTNAYQAAIELSQDQLDIAKEALTRAQGGVTAPENGVIVEKFVDKGMLVENGQELYRMQMTDSYVVRTAVSKFDISRIQVGQKADIKLGNLIYTGYVSAINPVAITDASGKAKIRVDITVDEPDENLILGIETDVTIHTGTVAEAITLPVEVVFSDDGGDYVYVYNGSESKKTYVECGYSDGEHTEILSGITLNDKIVANATGLEE